jgi:hypothetical protein
VPPYVKNLYERHKTKRTRPSLNEIVGALQSTAQVYSRVFISIDALDEYHLLNREGQYKPLSELFSLQIKTHINLFITSRFISEIISQFDGCIKKEIRAHDDDVLRYINERISQLLLSQISKHPHIQDAIRSDVVKAADGMYVHSSIKHIVSAGLTYITGSSLHDCI